MKNSICYFCEKEFQNLRGVKTHQRYCFGKRFAEEYKKKYVSLNEVKKLSMNSYFISYSMYLPEVNHKLLIQGEIGMLKGVRIIIYDH